jgi:hypothetical protein
LQAPYSTMIIPSNQSNILKHILENVILAEPGGQLEIALQQRGCQSILDLMALTPWEIETLQWKDGTKPNDTIARGDRCRVKHFQAFVLSLHPSPISMTTNDYLALTQEQHDEFLTSTPYKLICWNAQRPQPPPVTIKDGEQYCIEEAHDVFELFDADEFEASMIRSCESPPCMNEEDMTTKDDGIIKALENAIVFFETFCLMDDFEAHAMDDEPNVPGATANPETITTMPVPTNKDNEHFTHASSTEDTVVHIEYPDRTKFVTSMNHEDQFEELKTYNDVAVDASFFARSCPMV